MLSKPELRGDEEVLVPSYLSIPVLDLEPSSFEQRLGWLQKYGARQVLLRRRQLDNSQTEG